MSTSFIKTDKYIRLICVLRDKFNGLGNKIYSALVYGSCSRFEIFSIYSDVDLLCIIKEDVLKSETVNELHQIVHECTKTYKIKIHLRIRNITDLFQGSSGYLDCGFTSSINKLRDGILIHGASLDNLYLEYIHNTTPQDYAINIKNRLSDVCYQNRSLVSLIANYSDEQEYNNFLSYKCGCLLFQLAELICYTHGLYFSSTLSALELANKIIPHKLFSSALLIKQGKEKVELSYFVENLDYLIKETKKNVDKSNIHKLQNIVICKYGDLTDSDLIAEVDQQIQYKEPLKCITQMIKACVIRDGQFHIIYSSGYDNSYTSRPIHRIKPTL